MSLLSGSRAGFRADHHERSEVGGAEAEGLANDTGTEPARGLRQGHRGRVRTASTVFVHALTQDFRASSCTLRLTGGSWLDLVERWFALLTEKQLRRRAHRSTRELEDAIRAYLEPQPSSEAFIWTKTADQILESSPDLVNVFQTGH
jgi:hypothetical protein